MSLAQRYLNKFLQAELFHSLGSFNNSIDILQTLKRDTDFQVSDEAKQILPEDTIEFHVKYYSELRDKLHSISAGEGDHSSMYRHPNPLKQSETTECVVDTCLGLFNNQPEQHYAWVPQFYSMGIDKLKSVPDDSNNLFYDCLLDSHLKFKLSEKSKDKVEAKRKGFERKKYLFNKHCPQFKTINEDIQPYFDTLMNDNIRNDGNDNPLRLPHSFIIKMMIDAHMCLHYIEFLRSKPFGTLLEERQKVSDNSKKYLKLSLSINTFLHLIIRTAPWIFAENDEEADTVKNLNDKKSLVLLPPLCLWIAQQICLLTLYRRAYGFCMLGKNKLAFNDYLKAQHFVRMSRRSIDHTATSVKGANYFLTAMDALCEFRMGELYRVDHAHTRAFEHFCKAYDRTEELCNIPIMEPVLRESRWRIDLMLSKGKAFYELGYFKRSLKWYARSWNAFLHLTAEDSKLELNSQSTNQLIEWLTQIRNEPDINKNDMVQKLTPFVAELKTARVSPRLRRLAADILNRIGHILHMMKLETATLMIGSDNNTNSVRNNTLAAECIKLAKEYDKYNTLIRANELLIFRHDASKKEYLGKDLLEIYQWPKGGSKFEQFARIYEYYLLANSINATVENMDDMDDTKKIALKLLSNFMSHTDSITVKLAQIYQYLMIKPEKGRIFINRSTRPCLEFVCLRRYSSFFPLLPRPSAFRVHGGGYFVRIHPRHEAEEEPYGIVIDPGTDYIENMYKVGHSLEEIDMIIVSHDHVDHIDSLDPILSLIHYRTILGRKKFGNTPLFIIGNSSVKKRYAFFNEKRDNELKIKVLDFRELGQEDLRDIMQKMEFAIEATPMVHEDTAGSPSYGFKIRVGDEKGPSIGIVGDTQSIPPVPVNERSNRKLINSDVLVAHVSSVPLTQLKELANVNLKNKSCLWLKRQWDDLVSNSDTKRDKLLYDQIKFAFWLARGHERYLFESPERDSQYVVPGQHLHLNGIIGCAEEYKKIRGSDGGVLVVSELREELATFRTKIAKAINTFIFNKTDTKETKNQLNAITADQGLNIIVENRNDRNIVRILCSICDIDNDCNAEERYHKPSIITEVCVKGEDEGIFYNCDIHDPGSQTEPMFVERLERYDVFGRHFS